MHQNEAVEAAEPPSHMAACEYSILKPSIRINSCHTKSHQNNFISSV